MNRILVIAAVAFVALIIAAMSMFFVIQQAEQGLVLRFGEVVRVTTEPGLGFKLPWENVVIFDKRVQEVRAEAQEVLSLDQKRLVVTAFARYRIVDALQFYQSDSTTAIMRLTRILISNLNNVLARQPFAALLSAERASVMQTITERVAAEARRFGVAVIDVRITRADLPEANSQAIFGRMQTERLQEANGFRAKGRQDAIAIEAKADREAFVLIAEARRQAEITKGEGDAERARIFAEAFSKDPEFFAFYRSLAAYREAFSSETTLVISPDSEFFRYFAAPAPGPAP